MKRTFNIIIFIFAFIGFSFVAVYIALYFGWTNTKGAIDRQNDFFQKEDSSTAPQPFSLAWRDTEDWKVFKESVTKDVQLLQKIETETGIPARMIMSMLAVEQLRLYGSDREIFKKAFSPLKILGAQTQFSWGIMGVKKETAIDIEQHLKDKTSDYYLGEEFENALNFTTDDIEQERFLRMTSERDHYYSYLYASLYLKQFIVQWKRYGIDISSRPEILGTLYNIGFAHSEPKTDPQAGGAEITVGEETYTFGGLAYNIYYSDELVDIFPKK